MMNQFLASHDLIASNPQVFDSCDAMILHLINSLMEKSQANLHPNTAAARNIHAHCNAEADSIAKMKGGGASNGDEDAEERPARRVPFQEHQSSCPTFEPCSRRTFKP